MLFQRSSSPWSWKETEAAWRKPFRLLLLVFILLASSLFILKGCGSQQSQTCKTDKECAINYACSSAGVCIKRNVLSKKAVSKESESVSQVAVDRNMEEVLKPTPLKERKHFPAFLISDHPCQDQPSCPFPYACNLSSGICERRPLKANALDFEPYFYSPTVAAAGDRIIIEGNGLYFSSSEYRQQYNGDEWVSTKSNKLLTEVYVGGKQMALGFNDNADSNRIAFDLPAGVKGTVTISLPVLGYEHHFQEPLTIITDPDNVQSCDEKAPVATAVNGTNPFSIGPHAVGHVDSHVPFGHHRIYYPAICGGMRTEPDDGPFPLVFVLHGDGATNTNYQFLSQHLASWGYFVVAPETKDVTELVSTIKTGLNSPGKWFPPLQGLTMPHVALIGHSRGSERIEDILRAEDLPVDGYVFIAPVNHELVNHLPSLFITASEDTQAINNISEALWHSQPPPSTHVHIIGGNHSQFTDSRNWDISKNDGDPKIARKDQFVITQSYTLNFLRKIFHQKDPHPNWFENAFSPDVVKVKTK